MHKLFVRLVASGAIALGLGASAFASGGAEIAVTGPGSTNLVTSSRVNRVDMRMFNRADVGNWNNQSARSGNVWVSGNTKVFGDGLGSGSAFNENSGQNFVDINNDSMNGNWGSGNWGGGSGGGGTIFLTGPHSFNQIGSNQSNSFKSNVVNNVQANNFNNQTAKSGNVIITGNTVVRGVGGSGDAANFNSGVNEVNIANSTPNMGNWGSGSNWGGGGATIDTTGPGSFNAIRDNNSNRVSESTINNVSAVNSNHQTATTGSVVISGNTVVSGVGGSGNAFNSNMAENGVGLSNN